MRYSDWEQRQMDIKSGEELDRRSQKGRAMQPRVTDNDKGEITVTLEGRELRGWSYKTRGDQREKMAQAREYVEGWCDGFAAQREALTKLSNEVLASLPLMEPLARREFGNTNYNILIQRAEEARALLSAQ